MAGLDLILLDDWLSLSEKKKEKLTKELSNLVTDEEKRKAIEKMLYHTISLTGDEIYERLKSCTRWGCNDQPSLYLAVAILEQLPCCHVGMLGEETLELEFTRDLRPIERWALDKLNPDTAEISKQDNSVRLWWD